MAHVTHLKYLEYSTLQLAGLKRRKMLNFCVFVCVTLEPGAQSLRPVSQPITNPPARLGPLSCGYYSAGRQMSSSTIPGAKSEVITLQAHNLGF